MCWGACPNPVEDGVHGGHAGGPGLLGIAHDLGGGGDGLAGVGAGQRLHVVGDARAPAGVAGLAGGERLEVLRLAHGVAVTIVFVQLYRLCLSFTENSGRNSGGSLHPGRAFALAAQMAVEAVAPPSEGAFAGRALDGAAVGRIRRDGLEHPTHRIVRRGRLH